MTLEKMLFLISLSILLLFFVLFFTFWWLRRGVDVYQGTSPYTGNHLRSASELSYIIRERILRYLNEQTGYENRPFALNRASFCRDTGRIFPESVNWWGTSKVDWSFISKRAPGHYVSWGSLHHEDQERIRRIYGSLEGFQTQRSSSRAAPQLVEPEFIYLRPGPLYVDPTTDTLVGWQGVPGTDFEVLIVKKTTASP